MSCLLDKVRRVRESLPLAVGEDEAVVMAIATFKVGYTATAALPGGKQGGRLIGAGRISVVGSGRRRWCRSRRSG